MTEDIYIMGVDLAMKPKDITAICVMKKRSDGIIEIVDTKRITQGETTGLQFKQKLKEIEEYCQQLYKKGNNVFKRLFNT